MNGQIAPAIATWEQWSKTHPGNAGVYAVMGSLEEQRGDLKKAEADYRMGLQMDPTQAMCANNLAFLLVQQGGNLDVAMTLAQTARRGMPNSAQTADTLAWIYYNKGTYGFAHDLLEDAVKIDPNKADIQYHLGMVYAKQHDKTNATLHLKKALTLDPNGKDGKNAKAALATL